LCGEKKREKKRGKKVQFPSSRAKHLQRKKKFGGPMSADTGRRPPGKKKKGKKRGGEEGGALCLAASPHQNPPQKKNGHPLNFFGPEGGEEKVGKGAKIFNEEFMELYYAGGGGEEKKKREGRVQSQL